MSSMIKATVILGNGLMVKSNKGMENWNFQLQHSRQRNGLLSTKAIGKMIGSTEMVSTLMRMAISIKESLKMVKPTVRVHLHQWITKRTPGSGKTIQNMVKA